jgi:hypothetical protein
MLMPNISRLLMPAAIIADMKFDLPDFAAPTNETKLPVDPIHLFCITKYILSSGIGVDASILQFCSISERLGVCIACNPVSY